MPSQGFRLGLPPPVPLFDASIENIVDVTKIVTTRPGTVTFIGGWISGDPGGADPNQPGRFHIYADDGSGLNPGAFRVRTAEGVVSGATPQEVCIKLPAETAGIHLPPGIYWVGVFVGNVAGTGEWQVHGEANASGIGKKNTSIYPTQPDPFPLAGVTTFNGTTAALGFVFVQDPAIVTGSICGTFKCGTKKAGEVNIPFNTSTLELHGKRFSVFVANDFKEVKFPLAPKMILKGKAASVAISVSVSALAPRMLLLGQETLIDTFSPPRMQKPVLYINGVTFALSVHGIADAGTPFLYLLGAPTNGRIPGLVATVPEDVILVPTAPINTIQPAPTDEVDLILVPTVPRNL